MNTLGAPTSARSIATDRSSWWALAAWIIVIVAAGWGVGVLFAPDAWFAQLSKPSWNPPGALFGPVWTMLYVLMGVSIWLVRKQADASVDERRVATRLFLLQLALNLAWTPLFFGLHNPLLAFVDICMLWGVVLWMAVEFGKIRPLAGYLLGPYLLWLSFALVLNGTIGLMNG